MTRVAWCAAALAALLAAGCGDEGAEGGGGSGGAAAAKGGGPGKAGGGGGGTGGRGPMAFPVEVAPVATRDVEYVVSAAGSVEAFETVQITARVAGVVERVLFTEGQAVKKGQALAEVEPSRYAIAVRQARAAVEKAQASAADAEAGLKRREQVNAQRPGLLPTEELETFRTRARTAQAEASSARAQLAQAELNLRDAYVRAPMDGVLQTRTVQTGQYVQPGAVLATLLRRDPLLLRFAVPEGDAGGLEPGQPARFTVREDGQTYTATLTYVAASADPQNRLVRAVAEIRGEVAQKLRPGAFASVTVPVGSSRQSPVVPQTAVRPSEKGFLAYTVHDGKAKERVLQLGLRTADGLVEVRQGLQPGETLVVRGAEALRDGAAVRVVDAPKVPVKAEGGEAGGPRGAHDGGGEPQQRGARP